MNCHDLISQLLEFLDGELAGDHRAQAEIHLRQCHNCTHYVESYTHTVRISRRLPRCGPLPTNTESRLRAALRDHLSEKQ